MDRIRVPREVFEGIEFVRQTGRALPLQPPTPLANLPVRRTQTDRPPKGRRVALRRAVSSDTAISNGQRVPAREFLDR